MLEFRLLGPLEVVRNGEVVTPTGQKQRTLLALLLLNGGRVVSNDAIVDALWSGQPTRTAATSVQNLISQLRKLVGPDALRNEPPGYVLRVPAEQVDVAQFRALVEGARALVPAEAAAQLRDALALWRGSPLPELAYDAWAQTDLAQLEELRLTALEQCMDAELELGRHAELVHELEALVREQPLRERPRAQLMLALYRSGRQAEALSAYQDVRRVLLDELGIEPGPTLQQLHQSILRQERGLAPEPVQRTSDDHLDEVVRALLAARLVPVLGPDAARSGRPADAPWEHGVSSFAPADDELAEHLARYFSLPDAGGLARVSQLVSVMQGTGALHDELHTLLNSDFAPGPAHLLLASLPPLLRERGLPHQLIVTTLLDQTLERAFQAAGEELDVVSYISAGRDRGKFLHLTDEGTARVVEDPNADAEISLERRTVLLKVHGRVDRGSGREWESFVVSEDDYIEYLDHAEVGAVIPVTLAARLQRSHFLFLGYRPSDWSLRVFLHRLWGHERINYRSWAVQPAPDAIVRELWRQRGVDAVDATVDEYVEALAGRIEGHE